MARTFRMGSMLLTVALAAAACGGGGGTDDESCPSGSTLSIVPPVARVTAGGGFQDFGANLTGCQADMTWSLTGPGALDRTTGVPVRYTVSAALTTPATATVTVHAGGLVSSAVVTIDPSSLQLAGRVIGGNGLPVAGATVTVGTTDAVSGADGAFTLRGVSPPYDLTVAAPDGLVRSVYPGLRRADPTLVLFDEAPTLTRAGHAAGAVSGGAGFPPPAGREAGVAFGGAEVAGAAPVAASGIFDLGLAWTGPASITGALHALQWQVDQDGRPLAYDGHARRAGVMVTSGARTADQDLALAPVAAAAVSGTIARDGGATAVTTTLALWVTLGDGARLRILPPPSSASPFPGAGAFAGTFSLPTPAVPGATADVLARLEYAGGGWEEAHRHGLVPSATGVALVFGGVPTQHRPPIGAVVSVASGGEFVWHSMAGGPVYVASFRGPAGSPGLDVFTMGQGFLLPGGSGAPVGATYRWRVSASTAFPSVDAAAGPGGWLADGGAHERGGSGEWTFTFGP